METNLQITLDTGCSLIPVLINYTVGNLSELPNASQSLTMISWILKWHKNVFVSKFQQINCLYRTHSRRFERALFSEFI